MRTSNPALSDKVFQTGSAATQGKSMTISGTVNKSFVLIALVLISAFWSWQNAFSQAGGWGTGARAMVPSWYWLMIIGTLVVAVIIISKKTTAPFLAPIYALGEGLLLGTISAMFEARYPGIVLQAVMATAAVFVSLLLVYKAGIIKVTENFKLGVAAATGGIFLVYLLNFGLRFFGMEVPYLHSNGIVGIGISVFIVVIAAMNLVLDFDFIEKGAERGAPKYMEWYAAFGLLVTLVWLYLEILRLLGKGRSR